MIAVEEARNRSIEALMNAGVPREYAIIQTDVLIEAELRGNPSHGLLRLPMIIKRIRNGVTNPGAKGSSEWILESFLLVDGENGLGPVVAWNAINKISEKSESTGISIAAVSNSNHIGMLAWYAEKVAKSGKVLIGLTTSEALVHPWGGREAMVGTNPITVGVPASPKPFILDMATSLVSMGKIHDYANRKESIPDNWALDSLGNPTTDPEKAKKGALTPFGDAKGYALGLAIEVLVGSLTRSALGRNISGTLDSSTKCNKGDIYIVINPLGSQLESVSSYLDEIRDSSPSDPNRPVLVPGDRAIAERKKNLEEGIDVPDSIWMEVTKAVNLINKE